MHANVSTLTTILMPLLCNGMALEVDTNEIENDVINIWGSEAL